MGALSMPNDSLVLCLVRFEFGPWWGVLSSRAGQVCLLPPATQSLPALRHGWLGKGCACRCVQEDKLRRAAEKAAKIEAKKKLK